jgi:hypothetical protein
VAKVCVHASPITIGTPIDTPPEAATVALAECLGVLEELTLTKLDA